MSGRHRRRLGWPAAHALIALGAGTGILVPPVVLLADTTAPEVRVERQPELPTTTAPTRATTPTTSSAPTTTTELVAPVTTAEVARPTSQPRRQAPTVPMLTEAPVTDDDPVPEPTTVSSTGRTTWWTWSQHATSTSTEFSVPLPPGISIP